MKKILALMLVLSFVLTACTPKKAGVAVQQTNTPIPLADSTSVVTTNMIESEGIEYSFTGLNDPNLLRYVEDSVYSDIINAFNSDAYFVENVSTLYVSKEYLDELAYNSQANIYFGYTFQEISDVFQGTKYVFTLGEDGQTTVQEFEAYDDTFDRVVRNVAIGAGVILLCVTVSTVTTGIAPAMSFIFAASAKSASIFALSGGVFGGVVTGVVTGSQTMDLNESIKAAALSGSEGFMWGAMSGAITGGTQAAVALKGATIGGLTMNQVAAIQRESKYPLDVIKGFKTVEQYEILKSAGLKPVAINGKTALIRDIDLDFIDERGRTNLQRMEQGLAALDPTGQRYELHHIGQNVDSTLAMLTKAEHMQGGNDTIWHLKDITSRVRGPGTNWNAERIAFWKSTAKQLQTPGGII